MLNYPRVIALLQALFALVCVLGMLATYQSVQQGVRIESDLKKLFPDNPAHPLVNDINARLFAAFGDQLVMGLSGTDKIQLLAANARLLEKIAAMPNLTLVTPTDQVESLAAQQSLLLKHRYGLLNDEQRARMHNQDDAALRQDAARALMGFRSTGLDPLQDPFNLAQANLQRLDIAIDGELEGDQLLLKSGDEFLLLSRVQLVGEAFSLPVQASVREFVEAINITLGSDFSGVSLQLSGAVFHAAEASFNAEREMTVIGGGSLVGIILLFLLAFRRAAPLLLTLSSVAFGCGVAFVMTQLIFNYVHVITLVFGASLIGVAVDYSLHYLCKLQACNISNEKGEANHTTATVRRFLLPALGLSLLTSVLGYSCLLQTPLVGLQQIAAFSVMGLIAAWLWVMVLFPYLAPRQFAPSARIIDACATLFWRALADRRRFFYGFLATIGVILVIAGASQLQLSRDVRTLYTPSPALLASERYLQEALKGVSPNQYFLLKAPDSEALLQLEERFISEQLQPLVAAGDLLGVVATSQWVPSIKTQAADYALMGEYLYGEQARVAAFFAELGLAGADAAARAYYQEAAGRWLAPEAWLGVARPDQALLWLGEYNGEQVSIVALRGVRNLTALAALDTGGEVIFVDRVGQLSRQLQTLMLSAAGMLAWAYGIIALVLMAVYRRPSSLLVAAVPLASTLLALALLSLAGVAINLFHLFGCYLILGLGIDYAIFAYVNGERDKVARRAIWLAAMTSSLSFGLLALSVTPMVQAFGITLALGCLFNLLLAPLVSGRGQAVEKEPVSCD